MRRWGSAALAVGVVWAATTAHATTLKYAFQGDLNSLDPYSLNETFSLGALGNVMEGLTRRDKDLKIIPGLAESWEVLEPTRWRFHLRHNVKFQGGEPFGADDVLFSLDRMRSEGSQIRGRAPADMKAVKVDNYTVDFILSQPNPILNAEWDTWYMVSKAWAERVGATQAQSSRATSLNSWALEANGTGPFKVVAHEPGVRTVFRRNAAWWGKPEHNLDEVVFTTIQSDATRVAALLSGEVDLIDPVPVQDIARVANNVTTKLMAGPELRTIFLNMDSFRNELTHASVKGRNPFKDARVRKAIYQAIDIEAIRQKVMRGQSVPSALLISPLLFSRGAELKRHPFDVAAAKALLTEAGYGEGFEVRLDCPNDRYVNDDEICTAIATMLARIKIKVTVNAQPKSRFFEFAGSTGKYDSSFNILGWTPGSFDSYNVLVNIAGCRDADGNGGLFNYGGYCNRKVAELTRRIAVESDRQKRDDLILQAFTIIHEEAGIIPLHQQVLAWGVAKTVTIPQRADNQILFYWAQKR